MRVTRRHRAASRSIGGKGMMRLQNPVRLVTALGLTIVLAGCEHGNPLTGESNVAALQKAAPQPGQTFTQALANEYSSFAASEQAQYDYNSADYFAKKGLA